MVQSGFSEISLTTQRHNVDMTRKQSQFIFAWILMLAVLVIGSFMSAGMLIATVVAVGLIVSTFQKNIVPSDATPRTPLQVLEEDPFWKGTAIIYTVCLVGVVIYHLAVNRIAFFDNVPFGFVVLLLLGPGLGPIMVCQIEIYRLLGRE